jgi:ribosomal protein S18 acetylase RimI-like enzyme
MTASAAEVRVCRAAIGQVNQLAPLFDAYRQFYEQASDIEGARRYLVERLMRDESIIFLAQQGEEAVGFTQLYPTFSSVSLKPLLVLNDLYVIPAVRKQGVGEALLRRAQEFAIGQKARGLTLQTAVDNPAQRLYEKMGWVRDTAFYYYLWVVPTSPST